jgi:predicted RND superfamily exporter protein
MRRAHRPLLKFVLGVVAHPVRTLVIAGLVLAASVAVAVWKLEISADQNRLFNPNVPFFRDYLSFIQNFPDNEAIYLVIESKDSTKIPPLHRWTELADGLAARLRAMPDYVASVDHRVSAADLGDQGLLFDEPQLVRSSFDDFLRFVPLIRLWAEKPGVLDRVLGASPLERFITGLRTQAPSDQLKSFVEMLARSIDQTLRGGQVQRPDLAALDATDPSRLGYYYVPDDSDSSRRLMLVRVYHRQDYTSLGAVARTVETIRIAVGDTASSFPEFVVGLTGRPALEADEMLTTDRDTHRAEILALAAVFVGLVVMLRSWWLALAGEIALAVGIGWTFGWATISVGELNLLSIVFLLALIGIGMDYLVQILARCRQEFRRRVRAQTIWTAVFRQVAAPINTACLGAAGAFLVSMLTDFSGAAQLGLIAGGGLVLCLVAGYVILPSLLTLLPPKAVPSGMASRELGPPARGGPVNLITPALWMVLLLAGIPLALRTSFDPSLLNMQAANLESVKLVRKLQTWSLVVLSNDLETLRIAREAAEAAPTVRDTESLLAAYDNLEWLRSKQNDLPQIAWVAPAAVSADDVARLAGKVRALGTHLGESAAIESLAGALDEHSAEASAVRLSDWQRAFVEQLHGMTAQFQPEALDPGRLPPQLRNHFVGSDGTLALYIHPKGDLWKQQELIRFIEDVEPRVRSALQGRSYILTGIAHNIHNSTAAIERSFYRATTYAIVLIVILVFIDLRNVGQTLAAVSVLGLGLPMLVAMMGLFGIDWNFANFFGLPILIGAGHEYGVFLVHRYREALHDPRRVWRRWDTADGAMLLCAYITCVAFGFFALLAHHQGLRSLGLVMTLGTFCIYLAAVLVLRPLLIWRLASREQPRRPLRGEIAHEE